MAYGWLRPILFRLDPERAHALSLSLLGLTGAFPPLRAAVRSLFAPRTSRPVEVFGLSFANPIGLAAGYDKDGTGWRGLASLGFGHLEIGTVTPLPQPGNDRPRVFRLPADRSVINRLGFPSRGAEFVATKLEGRRPEGPVLGVNIGKQKATALDDAADDYVSLMTRFALLADYLAVNVSSPNTPELRDLQEGARLHPLLLRLRRHRDSLELEHRRSIPLLVKLAPDLDDAGLDEALDAILSARIDGVIATNTTTDRSGLRSPAASETGGLSGAALTQRSTALVGAIHRRTDGRLPIVACGGVMGPDDAMTKLDAGARLVQLYTGLVYEGPSLVRRIVEALR